MASTIKMVPAMMEDLSSKSPLFAQTHTHRYISYSPTIHFSVEQNKFDGTSFDTASPDTENMSVKIPAKIQYCKSIRAWVFLHEYIRKSTRDDSECPWLLRSEETEVYDIEEVQGPWQVWAGVIRKTDGMYFHVPL